jgi:predicted ribosomally synthesized peptide with SipW-like signal peptide
MKQIIKSALMIVASLSIIGSASGAYFTSTVTAADNQITTGTLALAIDSSIDSSNGGTGQLFGLPYTWNVAYQDSLGANIAGTPFTPWVGAAPGDSNSYFVAVRNLGSVPAQIRAAAVGRWTAGPRFGTLGCPADAVSANAALISVSQVHQYATGNCEGVNGCENLYYGLTNVSYFNEAGVSAQNSGPWSGYFYGVTSGTPDEFNVNRFALAQNEFVVYRVDAQLSTAADNCYQGATYTFDLTVEGKQVADPAW